MKIGHAAGMETIAQTVTPKRGKKFGAALIVAHRFHGEPEVHCVTDAFRTCTAEWMTQRDKT